MKKKRLLYALESAGGGTLKHVTCLATRLNREEFDVTVVLPNEMYEADTQVAAGFMRQKGICVDTLLMPKRISWKDIQALCGICSYLQKKGLISSMRTVPKPGRFFVWPPVLYMFRS
jgi:hypothetical protein